MRRQTKGQSAPAKKLRVMLVDESSGRSAILEQALRDTGYDVVAKVGSDEDLNQRVAEIQPDVIIIDMELPDRDTLEHMQNISRDRPKPIVMFAQKGDTEMIHAAVKAGVSAYVVDGLKTERVQPILEVAIARFREFQALREELDKTKTTLAERKVIEKAKGLLMKQRGFSEEEAYQALRKLAMNKNQRIAQVAADVISVAELLSS